MNESERPVNEIAELVTRSLDESTSAIMVALNIGDRSTARPFVKEVLHKILMQRMLSPPDTSMMCITIIGSVTAREFASLWRKYVDTEPGMAVFLQQMRAADVIHGTRQGKVLEQVSLLEPGGAGKSASPPPTAGQGGWLARLISMFQRGQS